jgi:sulfite exporter TauE/SafE
VNEFGYGLAFVTGLFGALHCIGMCSGLAAGCFVGRLPRWRGILSYHGLRILTYTGFGVAGALAGRVLVQNGLTGKFQGLLMLAAGALISLMAVRMILGRATLPRSLLHYLPLPMGVVNGLIPCSLVFSVALKAAATADPLRAGGLMLAFGLGTLPTLAALSWSGSVLGVWATGIWARLAGLALLALGLWTVWEAWVFWDVMRGLANG